MRFENAFVVQAPIDEVWATLLDVERVAPCMPGAEVLERAGEDAYRVAVSVKLGPMSMRYRGQVEIAERDEAAHAATLRAKATEARGQGTADATVRMTLAEQAGGTHATLATDLAMSGRVAAMGQGVIVDVASRLVEQFAANLATLLAGAPEGAEAEAAPGAPGAPAETSLEAGKLAAGVIAGRLEDPRVLLCATAAVALAGAAVGYAIGKAT